MTNVNSDRSEASRIEATFCQSAEPLLLGAIFITSIALVIIGSLALPAHIHSLPWGFFTKIPMDQSILMLSIGALGIGVCIWRLKPPKPKLEITDILITQIEGQLQNKIDAKLYYYPNTNTVKTKKSWFESKEDRFTLLRAESGEYFAKTDKKLGNGTQKTAYLAKSVNTGAPDQVRTVQKNPPKNDELTIYEALKDCPHVVHCMSIPKNSPEKRTLILEMCPIALKDLQTFTEAQILTLFEEYLRGLAALHEVGYLHLDCHRGNLYIDTEGHGRLADFGSSRLISTLNTPMGFAQMLPDSASYLPIASSLLAPEIIVGIGHREALDISGKADVWSLGYVLGYLLKDSIKDSAFEKLTLVQNKLQPKAKKFQPFALKAGEHKAYRTQLIDTYPPEPPSDSVDYLIWKMLHPNCNLRFSALEAADYISNHRQL